MHRVSHKRGTSCRFLHFIIIPHLARLPLVKTKSLNSLTYRHLRGQVTVKNRAFANVYAFSQKHVLLEAGLNVDGLEWQQQWWGDAPARRRRSGSSSSSSSAGVGDAEKEILNPFERAVSLAGNPAFRRRHNNRRRAILQAVRLHWPPEPPIELPMLDGEDSTIDGGGNERVRRSVVHTRYRWPNGIVAYRIDSSVSAPQRTAIADAMMEYTTLTCLRFVERQAEAYYVHFRASSECEARANGRSVIGGVIIDVNGGADCQADAMLHKLGHAIGMFHESNRPDRDLYVVVYPGNSSHPDYFIRVDKHAGDVWTSAESNLGIDYDFDSAMHPRRTDDLKSSLEGTEATTMELTPLGATMADPITFGRGSGLSPGDEVSTACGLSFDHKWTKHLQRLACVRLDVSC